MPVLLNRYGRQGPHRVLLDLAAALLISVMVGALQASDAAAQTLRATIPGGACASKQARCTTDLQGRRLCQLPGQSQELCSDPRFRIPKPKTFRFSQQRFDDAMARCMADGMGREMPRGGGEASMVIIGGIRARCAGGEYRRFLDAPPSRAGQRSIGPSR